MSKKPKSHPSTQPTQSDRTTSFLKVQLHCWPPPGDPAVAKLWHGRIVDELRRLLDPVRLKNPSAGYHRPASPSLDAGGIKCWVDSSSIRSCTVSGQETVCRVDHYLCSDGSWYDVQVPLIKDTVSPGESTDGQEQ